MTSPNTATGPPFAINDYDILRDKPRTLYYHDEQLLLTHKKNYKVNIFFPQF